MIAAIKYTLIHALIALGLTACTYSITMVHTEGSASDVVDEVDSVTPSTSVTVPISTIP
jgi:hypothetical protein